MSKRSILSTEASNKPSASPRIKPKSKSSFVDNLEMLKSYKKLPIDQNQEGYINFKYED